MEHHVTFNFSAPYYTLNTLSDETTNIWIVCPGYGQLAKYFIKRFDVFDSNSHFIIALQGLSKFYLPDHKHVGASWMTKEDRATEMKNQQKYFQSVIEKVFENHNLDDMKLNLLGFSQGVSMISRMAASSQMRFENLILWAGGFPPELKKEDFSYLSDKAQLKVVLGTKDEYYDLNKNYQTEIDKMESAIGISAEVISFNGKHEINREVLYSCWSN
jgi:predicted esterase